MKEDTLVYLTLGVILALVIYYGADFMPDTILDKMAKAIMEFEGYFEGSVSYKNNNPGNIKNVGQFGSDVGTDSQGHAIFPTFQDGYNALIKQLRLIVYGGSTVYNPSMTFYQVFAKYAEGNSRQYAEFVASRLGVPPTARMQDIAA
jgi:hypothetical protein